MAARLGIDISSEDWSKIKHELINFKYTGIFKDSHNRWWSQKLEEWWTSIFGINNLRRLNANERVKLLNDKFNLDLKFAIPTKFSKSTKFWTICKGTSMPLDPFDGIQIIKKDYKAWQEREYFSKEYALAKIDVEKYFIDETDLKYLRELAKGL